jgi:autotransporter-associated beta strand protein
LVIYATLAGIGGNALTKAGTDRLCLSGVNTYAGDTLVEGASLFHYRVAFSRPELRFRPWNGRNRSCGLQHYNAKQGEQGCARWSSYDGSALDSDWVDLA